MDNELIGYVYYANCDSGKKEGAPNVENYGVTTYIVIEHLKKLDLLQKKWAIGSFEEKTLIGYGISCFIVIPTIILIINIPLFSGFTFIMIAIHIGLYFGTIKVYKKLMDREFNLIKNKLIDKYLDDLRDWKNKRQKDYNRRHNYS